MTAISSTSRRNLETRPAGGDVSAVALGLLVVLLPFEPRAFALSVGGFRVTLLEAAAAVAMIVFLAVGGRRLGSVVWRSPLLALLVYAGIHLLSAAATPYHPDLAFKFALRMAALAAFASLVATLPGTARRRGLLALAGVSVVLAALAVAEGVGARLLEPFLDLFRETPFNVAGARRATAGSEYPNLAAAFLMYGLLAGVGLATAGRRRGIALVLSAAIACGLAFTYSRGALVAALVGLVALAVREGLRERRRARLPAACAAVLLVISAAFAAGGEVFRLRLASEGTGEWYGATYEPMERVLRLAPGERRETAVRLVNTGHKTWSDREAFHLSYHLLRVGASTSAEGTRSRFSRSVRPGEAAVATVEVRAPAEEGRYVLIWDMVHERTTWFSGQGVAPAPVPLVVSRRGDAAAAEAAEVPPELAGSLVWQPRRPELWRLAAQLWQERPLLGAGPDNYRHLYGPRAGRTFWDDRVYANNTLIEAGATTGTLGALALAAVLAFTLIRAARSSALESAALFAMAAGITAHGVVDYVLAATGHYLLFGLVVGATAALESLSTTHSTS